MTHGPSGTRILVVDDDELSRELLTVLLEGEGYLVNAVESGHSALLVLETEGAVLPDAVLADMQMPGLAGAALAGQLRSIVNDGTRLLAMSGSQPKPEALAEFDGFLLKPFTMEDLAAAVRGRTATTAPPQEAQEAELPRQAAEDEEADTETALDPKTFRELSEMMRPKQMGELYGMGLRDGETHLRAMRLAAAAGDDAGFKRRAHAMKGSFGMLGARDLQAAAAEMEMHGAHNTDYLATLERFALAMETLRRILMARGLPLGSAGN